MTGEAKRIAQLEARVKALEEGMRPFVWREEPWMAEQPDNHDTGLRACVTWGEYRRARGLLTGEAG